MRRSPGARQIAPSSPSARVGAAGETGASPPAEPVARTGLFKTTTEAAAFVDPACSPAPRHFVRPVILAKGALLTGALAFGSLQAVLVGVTAGVSLALGLTLWVLGPRLGGQISGSDARSDPEWNGQLFNEVMSVVVLLATIPVPVGALSKVLLSFYIAMALLNGLTPFCLGRLIYVSFFRKGGR